MKAKIYCIMKTNTGIAFLRIPTDAKNYNNPTTSSLKRIQRLVPLYSCEAWLYRDETYLFIRIDRPVQIVKIDQQKFYPSQGLASSPEDDQYIQDQEEDYDGIYA